MIDPPETFRFQATPLNERLMFGAYLILLGSYGFFYNHSLDDSPLPFLGIISLVTIVGFFGHKWAVKRVEREAEKNAKALGVVRIDHKGIVWEFEDGKVMVDEEWESIKKVVRQKNDFVFHRREISPLILKTKLNLLTFSDEDLERFSKTIQKYTTLE